VPGPGPVWTAIGEGIADGSDLCPGGERDRNQPWQPQEHKEKAPRVVLAAAPATIRRQRKLIQATMKAKPPRGGLMVTTGSPGSTPVLCSAGRR